MPYKNHVESRMSDVKCPRFQRQHTSGGFSLIEIMVVLVIIGLLAGLVTINVRGYLIRARQNAARSEIATISDALETFYSTYNRYPTNEEGLNILTRATDQLPEPLLKQSPVDPWGKPYQYNNPGRHGPYDVFTLAGDSREGGSGEDADIGNWNLKQSSQAAASAR